MVLTNALFCLGIWERSYVLPWNQNEEEGCERGRKMLQGSLNEKMHYTISNQIQQETNAKQRTRCNCTHTIAFYLSYQDEK